MFRISKLVNHLKRQKQQTLNSVFIPPNQPYSFFKKKKKKKKKMTSAASMMDMPRGAKV